MAMATMTMATTAATAAGNFTVLSPLSVQRRRTNGRQVFTQTLLQPLDPPLARQEYLHRYHLPALAFITKHHAVERAPWHVRHIKPGIQPASALPRVHPRPDHPRGVQDQAEFLPRLAQCTGKRCFIPFPAAAGQVPLAGPRDGGLVVTLVDQDVLVAQQGNFSARER